ncbi:uncharacterized protein BJ212DRAFT_1297322 [Suillus subaureus]|uniref:F-box domain-containing protein n=1 Tax=Suillus subaureus TaxID=48587 RepID=A0A9P7EGL8_9AGAM|nr:uncharacterized protein BJ212DRAFT_1297322 [Suillus subaureus]KAG1820817.1 hypothetical protein BJ212DRAFT_1297322 [Suillus subaureus]
MSQCSFSSLPAEIVFSILKAVLEGIVQDDMVITPEAEHWILAGGLPFPHSMALVCRRWRDIVSSTPELWTRIFWMISVPEEEDRHRINSQLEKSGNYPVHLTIINSWCHKRGIRIILHRLAPHLQQLKSLRMANFYEAHDLPHLDTLTGYAPQLESLQLTDGKHIHHCTNFKSRLKLDCPALRIFHVDIIVAYNLDHRWLKNNLTHVEFMTISCGSSRIRSAQAVMLSRALQAVPRRIPCLTLDNLQLPDSSLVSINQADIKIGAEQVILRTSIDALAAIDDDCQTIVIEKCDSVHDLQRISLPSSSRSLELDGCDSKEPRRVPDTRTWDGDAVTITNSHSSCIEIILHLLGAPFNDYSCSLWCHVTTLKLVANGDFVLNLPLTLLKAMITSRQGAAEQKSLSGKNNEHNVELNGVRPLMVLHVQGGQPLSREESVWFEKRVRDFVWDYKRR